VETTNDCQYLAVNNLQIVSEPILNETMDRLLKIGETTFEVQNTDSGLYIANSLTPRFSFDFYFDPDEGPLFELLCADEKAIITRKNIMTFYSEVEHLEKFLTAAKRLKI